jgi:hypothetical protein
MRLTRLPASLVSALLLAGAASCATTIEGSGTIASDVVTGGPTPGGSADPSGSSDPNGSSSGGGSSGSAGPTPTPSSTVSAVQVRERALCVLERTAITGINTSFNKTKQRSLQVQILKQGSTTLNGQLSRSGLPADDAILLAGKAVQTQLAKLYEAASGGNSPSTKPYNEATVKFQRACNSIP